MFSAYEKTTQIAPNDAGIRYDFLLVRTLPTFWAEQMLILIIFILGTFAAFQISRFPDGTTAALRSQPDPSPIVPRDQTHCKEPGALAAIIDFPQYSESAGHLLC